LCPFSASSCELCAFRSFFLQNIHAPAFKLRGVDWIAMTVLFACLTLALSIGLAACTNFSSQSPCHKGWACWGVTRYWAHICKCDDHWACTDSQHLTNHYANCDQFQYSTTKKCHKGLGWAGCGTEQVACKIHKAGHPHTGCQNNEDEETPHRYRYKA
jgi:hypothetical protein